MVYDTQITIVFMEFNGFQPTLQAAWGSPQVASPTQGEAPTDPLGTPAATEGGLVGDQARAGGSRAWYFQFRSME